MLHTSSQNSFNGSQSAFRLRKRKVTNYSRKPKSRSFRTRDGREPRTERKLSHSRTTARRHTPAPTGKTRTAPCRTHGHAPHAMRDVVKRFSPLRRTGAVPADRTFRRPAHRDRAPNADTMPERQTAVSAPRQRDENPPARRPSRQGAATLTPIPQKTFRTAFSTPRDCIGGPLRLPL